MTILLIDGDIIAYRCATSVEEAYDFGGVYGIQADPEKGKDQVDRCIDNYANHLKADNIIVALTDKKNFRKSILSTYKAKRKATRKPVLLKPLREHIEKNYRTFVINLLEADDVLGILATSPHFYPKSKKIIVSIDKDLRTIPSWHWSPNDINGKAPPKFINEEEANKTFYAQVLSGDPTDGYSGCPLIGRKKARELVERPLLLKQEEHKVKRGKNAGQKRQVWKSVPTQDIWSCIVSHYEHAGLSEEDALVQARCARILRFEDYDHNKKEPILWSPKTTKK